MVSVFIIEPGDIPYRKTLDKYNFDFLDILDKMHGIYPNIYYNLINSQDNFKIKNLYDFIFLRLNKINKKYQKIPTIEKRNKNIDKEYFNTIFKDYINNDILKLIIIINSIHLYFFPKLRNQ